MMKKRTTCFAAFMVAIMMTTSITPGALHNTHKVIKAAETTSNNEYGLAENIQDGTILHCFDWTYNDIKNELPNIAKAGFTSIQTSPAQPAGGGQTWYWLYQPGGFYIGNNPLGGKDELAGLCSEAEKYGIKIIVDVVANHTAGYGDDGLDGNNDYHHFGDARYDSREGITKGMIGMPDLNSESPNVYNKVKGYIEQLKSVGVDGIRWDAAKHISLPSEGCDFWKAVTSVGLYNYGEILGSPNERMDDTGKALMKEYTDYINVSDSPYGSTLLDRFRNGNINEEDGFWTRNGLTPDKLVYWSENHDTYANDGEYGCNSAYIDQNIVDRGYAVCASRANATSLYLSRPAEKSKASIMAGAKGSTHFTAPEVAEVNKLHNAKIGEPDSYEADRDAKVCAVCRTTGITVVKGSGSGEVTMKHESGVVTPGVYKDSITGNEFTVTYSQITGKVGEAGIATLYLEKATGEPRGTSPITEIPDSTTTDQQSTDQSDTQKIYFDNSSYRWSDVYCYIYADSNNNGTWPGVKMEVDENTGYYVYQVPKNLANGNIIFAESKEEGSANRYPADGQPGMKLNGKTQIFDSSKTLTDYTPAQIEETIAPTIEPTKKPVVTSTPTVAPTGTPVATSTPTMVPTNTPVITATPIVATEEPIPQDKPTEYKITYSLNGGSFSKKVAQTYTAGTIVKFATPTRYGYTFMGWYTDNSYTEKISIIAADEAGDITVYAKWSKNIKLTSPTVSYVKSIDSKKLKLQLKKKITGAKGYELVVATNKSFSANKKTYKFTGLSKIVTGLKKGKTYYIKVRTYATRSDGVKTYSSYSKVQKIKIK